MVREVHDRHLDPDAEGMEEFEGTLRSLRQDVEVAQVLLGFSAALAEVKTIEATLERVVKLVPDAFGAERCFAATYDDLGEFHVEARYGYSPDQASVLEEMASRAGGLPLLRDAVRDRQPILVADAHNDDRISKEDAVRRGLGGYIGLPLTRWGGDFGGVGVEFAQPQRFGSREEALARGITRQVGVALTNARRFNLLQDLRSIGLRIGGQLRLNSVLKEVARGAADLLRASAAAVYLLDSHSQTFVVTHGGSYNIAAPAMEHLRHLDTNRHPWSQLMEEGVLFEEDLRSALGSPDVPRAAAAATIPGKEHEVAGAVVALFEGDSRLGPEEMEALNVLTAQTATAVENAQGFERQRRVARSLQEGLLTTEVPETSGCEFAAVYEPASHESDIGGDFWDVVDLEGDRFGVVVGDVSGKGAEAAAQTAMAKYMLRAFAIRNPRPASVLFHLNNALVRGLGEDRFTTLLYAVFDPEQRTCQIAIGGHPPPLLYRHSTGEVEGLGLESTVLGIIADQQFEQMTVEIEPGDIFIAYTDGLVEARDHTGELYGHESVRKLLADLGQGRPGDIARRIYEGASAFGAITDDTVVVALTCRHKD